MTEPSPAPAMPAAAERAPAAPAHYVVLARKYRPQSFSDLIGQEAMVTTLRNAFSAGRIAQGYMLTGVRGVGKTTTARILARAMNYSRDGAPDVPAIDMPEPGRHCAEIMEGRHPDVLEMDAASNTGVDNIREVIESARYRPLVARYKVFIIDEVHMLSKGAFNALLKTLEEPPGHVRFIFATTEIRKVPVTVLSRCQRFDLRRVDTETLSAHLGRIAAREGATADAESLLLMARAAEGSVRDALSLLDQAIAMGQGEVTAGRVRAMLGLAGRGRIFDLLEHLFRGDAAAALAAIAALHRDGADPVQVLADLAEAVHAVARTKAAGPDAGGDVLSPDEKRRAADLARRLSVPVLSRAFQMLLKGLDEAGRARNPAAAAEMVLIRLAYVADLPPPNEVIALLNGSQGPTSRTPQPAHAGTAERGAQTQAERTAPPAGASTQAALPPAAAGAAPAALPAAAPGEQAGARRIASFADIVALAGEQRDAKLKVHLEDHVSLVKCDPAARTVEIFLLPEAPRSLAADLGAKLAQWTGQRWVVVVSAGRGERPIGDVRREDAAKELAHLSAHPAVAAVLEAFPEARISGVRPLSSPGSGADARDDEGAAEAG